MSDLQPQLPAEDHGPGPEESPLSTADGAGAATRKKRRRGTRGGKSRARSGHAAGAAAADAIPDDLPERIKENTPSPEAAERALVRRAPEDPASAEA
ncbi:MAG: hypothetical protein M3R01_05155, partial [Actinomycetota bacterium]|nr:hypothetical protein [Actinomycetota bacterium]